MSAPPLKRRQGLQSATLSGRAEWLVFNAGEVTLGQLRDKLLEVTTDPLVLGHVLGIFVVRAEEHPVFAPIADALRLTGHDEVRAEQMAAWQRARIARENHGGFRL